ncbi:MAG: hypothetical protein JNL09_07775, partial [Anaerolineales bacterium]|nr:hypothetical protein [Anaerolineales bacterium]
MAVKLEVRSDGDKKLIIHHEPRYAQSYIFALLALWGVGFYFLIPSRVCLAYIGFLTICALWLALSDRKLKTIIDKASGKVSSQRGGFLSSKIGTQEIEYSLSEIQSLEIQRHISNYGGGFQIKLRLISGKRINLSTRNL